GIRAFHVTGVQTCALPILRPLWRMAAQALQSLLTVPEGAYLTYDPREIAFLREDRLDAAQIEMTKASSLRQLTDAGANWDDAVRSGGRRVGEVGNSTAHAA